MTAWSHITAVSVALGIACSATRGARQSPATNIEAESAGTEEPVLQHVEVLESWEFPDYLDPSPGRWGAEQNGRIWFASYGANTVLTSLLTGGRSESFDVPGASYVTTLTTGREGELTLIADVNLGDAPPVHQARQRGQKREALTWSPKRPGPSVLELKKTPIGVAWIRSTGEVWYVATDNSLNIRSSDGEEVVPGEFWGIVVVSDDGSYVGADSSEGFIAFSASSHSRLWSLLSPCEGEVVGFGPGESVIVQAERYVMDDVQNTAIPARAKVCFRDGREKSLLPEGYSVVVASETRLVFLKFHPYGGTYVGSGLLRL